MGVEAVTGFENVIGTAAGDKIVGSAEANIITGADVLSGGGSRDAFIAGHGDDSVLGGEDAGDTGVDVYDFSGVAIGITVEFTGAEAGTVTGIRTGADTFAEIEHIVFTEAITPLTPRPTRSASASARWAAATSCRPDRPPTRWTAAWEPIRCPTWTRLTL